ncbi:MAG: hypothetical protein U9Q38_09225, partial [Thermodesulfobacteriota bacterium]|nr:hypothetical protein [Thermodesulfobacteriota bacterium]
MKQIINSGTKEISRAFDNPAQTAAYLALAGAGYNTAYGTGNWLDLGSYGGGNSSAPSSSSQKVTSNPSVFNSTNNTSAVSDPSTINYSDKIFN